MIKFNVKFKYDKKYNEIIVFDESSRIEMSIEEARQLSIDLIKALDLIKAINEVEEKKQ